MSETRPLSIHIVIGLGIVLWVFWILAGVVADKARQAARRLRTQ